MKRPATMTAKDLGAKTAINTPTKLKEIASRINVYLRRFEKNRKINRADPRTNLTPYWQPFAFTTGCYIGIIYRAWQPADYLSKSDALQYLEWLDSGHRGKHWAYSKMLKEGNV